MAKSSLKLVTSDKSQRAETFIAPHAEKHRAAVAMAKEAMETTSTQAWQNGYRTNMENHRQTILVHLRNIRGQLDNITTADTDEDCEKAIKESVKAMMEERIRHSAWRNRTVNSYEQIVEKCATTLLNTTRAAKEAEGGQPLIDRGLLAEVQAIVDTWPIVKWHDDSGSIEIVERSK